MYNCFRVLAAGAVFTAGAWGQQYLMTSIAGNGIDGSTGDGGPAVQSEVSSPSAIAIDAAGNVYFADGGVHRVRKIAANGTITTIAGNGTPGYTGDGAAATTAELNEPGGVAVDSQGNIYISDSGNMVIRMINPQGVISTIAGNNADGGGYTGDGGPATNAQLYAPAGIAVDSMDNLYIADEGNNVIRVVSNGEILTLGPGTNFQLKAPSAVTVDANGNVFVADTDNSRIAEFSAAGQWSVVAGNGFNGFTGDGGAATKAELSEPRGVAVDGLGQVYASDTLNGRIRLVSTTGTISTIAGNGQISYSGDGGNALQAAMFLPRGIALDGVGNIYICDTGNHRIREAIAVPAISQSGVVNAASFAAPLAPGSLATIFGQHFVEATVAAPLPLPTTLGGASVSVNGQQVPLLYATPYQINFQVPWSTATGNATITVTGNGQTSSNVTVPVVTAAPGIFQYGSGRAVVQNGADYSLNSPSAPAKLGSTIIAYLTGANPVSPTVPTGGVTPSGGLYGVTSLVTATIGTVKAQVSFTGLTPGFIGLEQANIVVPSGLTTGDYPLTITVNGQASNAATVSVTQ